MTQTLSTYEQQAIDFLAATNTEFLATFKKNGKHFDDDKDFRDIYKVTLKKGSRSYSFDFGQSIMNSQYYQDTIQERTYTLSGGCRTGNYTINAIEKYQSGSRPLKLVKGLPPTAYDVLTCLTKYDPGTFEDFCSNYGYDTDSRKAEKIYKEVCDEWLNVAKLFTDAEIEQLQEIQ